MSTKIQTKEGTLKYIYIKGEGRNQAMPGEDERMQYVISIVFPKDSEGAKHLQSLVEEEWTAYKKSTGVKGRPKTNGIKEEFIKDPEGKIDPETEVVRRIPTGNIIAQFKTNITWPDGKPQVVRVFDHKGSNITGAYAQANWAIGNDSTGVVFGSAVGNNAGGSNKVTLYLTAVQIGKLKKYEGEAIVPTKLDGDDIDISETNEDEILF